MGVLILGVLWAFHIDLGKSFLGLPTWSKQPSLSKQGRNDLWTLEIMLSRATWGVPEWGVKPLPTKMIISEKIFNDLWKTAITQIHVDIMNKEKWQNFVTMPAH